MVRITRRGVAGWTAALAAGLAALPRPGRAQAWPARPIRLIVPFAAGGITDTIARLYAAEMSERLGQQMLVENRGGAAAIIGTEAAARAPRDGYTLLFATTSPLAANPHMYRNLPYRMADFAPISLVAISPWLIAVKATTGARNVAEFLAYTARRGGELNYAMIGRGSASHIFAEMFMSVTGLRAQDVVYRGDGPGMQALLAGEVQFLSAGLSGPLLEHRRAGNLDVIGVASRERSLLVPDIPTFVEQGFPDILATSWFGLAAPAGAPREVITRLHEASVAAMANPTLHARIAATGAQPGASTPEEMLATMEADSARWGRQIARLGLRLD
jgi:tripartite-type tricarboxylate transporter receptor subunit TctC